MEGWLPERRWSRTVSETFPKRLPSLGIAEEYIFKSPRTAAQSPLSSLIA